MVWPVCTAPVKGKHFTGLFSFMYMCRRLPVFLSMASSEREFSWDHVLSCIIIVIIIIIVVSRAIKGDEGEVTRRVFVWSALTGGGLVSGLRTAAIQRLLLFWIYTNGRDH